MYDVYDWFVSRYSCGRNAENKSQCNMYARFRSPCCVLIACIGKVLHPSMLSIFVPVSCFCADSFTTHNCVCSIGAAYLCGKPSPKNEERSL